MPRRPPPALSAPVLTRALPRPSLPWSAPFDGTGITLDTGAPRQSIIGWGTCFTDTSAYNAMVYMRAPVRDQLLEAVWGETGLRANTHRMHINSPDYAVHSYNLDNVTDDFSLAHFDDAMAYDSQRVLPFVRLAMARAAAWGGPPLRLFGSPWSPPGWFKTNNNMINSDAVCLKNDTAAGDSYKRTWASYIVRWVAAVEAHLNTSMWAITPVCLPPQAETQ